MADETKPKETDGDVAIQEGKPRLKEPARYAVFLHNDDYTTFDFVVDVLVRFFKKTTEEATQITLKVHHEGKGLAGVFTYEIAETKVSQASDYARSNGFPLRCTAEAL